MVFHHKRLIPLSSPPKINFRNSLVNKSVFDIISNYTNFGIQYKSFMIKCYTKSKCIRVTMTTIMLINTLTT